MRGRGRRHSLVFAAVVAAVTFVASAAGATRPAELPRFHAAPIAGGLKISLEGLSGRRVAFDLGPHTVARFGTGPYSYTVAGVRLAKPHDLAPISLVAREQGNGRRLAVLALAIRSTSRTGRTPAVTITSSPADPTTSTSASITFTTTNASSVRCSLDGAAATTCSSPFARAGLAVGRHAFTVRASRNGQSATASASWTIVADAPAPPPAPTPTVSITGGPVGQTTATGAVFGFTTANVTSVSCSLDGAPGTACTSPIAYTGLGLGTHTFSVRVTGPGGSTSATASWTIVAPPPPAAGGVATGPAAPEPYVIPNGATRVTTAAQLVAELSSATVHDIVLADGVYDNAGVFADINGHHIYAEHLGRAVLRAGIQLGGNWGPGGSLVQGIAFQVSDPAKTDVGGIVSVWGNGKNAQVLDSTFDGGNSVGSAIRVMQPEGFVARRLVVRNFTSNGISVDTYPDHPTLAKPPVLTDLDIANVSRPVPRSSNGTAEACLWVGNQSTIQRVKLRNCAWMGLWTGSGNTASTISDVDVDGTPVGVYIEHFTKNTVFQHLQIGPGTQTGVNCEWADPAWGGIPASIDNTIQDSTIESSHVGVYLDDGTTRTAVRNVRFRNAAAAAIVDYRGVGNSYTGNDYSGLPAGAVAVSQNHL